MSSMLVALLVPICLATLVFTIVLAKAAIAGRAWPSLETLGLGAVVNFFDTLGIGSFAPTTAWLKFRHLTPDRLIPPTILVGLTAGAVVESIIFLLQLGVKVDPVLLVGCIVACTTGGLIGAPLVHKTRVWIVQFIVAGGLLLAALAYAMTNLNMFPGGGTAASLSVVLTILAIAANFGFGVLLNYGVGNYAPTLVILSLMGMDPRLCFPIMAGAAALMGATASIRHINTGNLDLRVVVGLTIGGIPAVFVAAYLVVTMPLELLRWLVLIVVLYAASIMLRAAILGRLEHYAEPGTAPLTSELDGKTSRPVAAGALSTLNIAGWVLVFAGLLGAILAFAMKTTVSTAIGDVNNLGLMNDQQNYLMVSGFIAVVGAIMIAARRRR